MFLLFLISVIFIAILIVFFSDNNYDFRNTIVTTDNDFLSSILKLFMHFIIPKKNSKIYNFYNNKLMYSKLTVEWFFAGKFIFMILAIILSVMINLTNIKILDNMILNRSINKTIYEKYSDNAEIAKDIEKIMFSKAIKEVDADNFKKPHKKHFAMDELHKILVNVGVDRSINHYVLKVNVYNMLKKYYEIRKFKWFQYTIIAICTYFLADIILFLYNMSIKSNKTKELSKLKAILLIGSSIQPNFNKILNLLIDNSKYYKYNLKNIKTFNNNNGLDKKEEYRKLISSIYDLEEKFFFERIQTINFGGFDSVTEQIKTKSMVDDINAKQRYEEKKENIEITGTLLSMILLLFCVYYIFNFWVNTVNVNKIIL